ncbi:MAG: hypothetical protein MUF87_01375 [Anaerolineae bacterium]|jgi:hypothetical protein|nr:hypothetical protein [Anaerolineae bacterium]
MFRKLLLAVPILLTLTAWLMAQAAVPFACPELVEEALIRVDQACGGLGRNEACYGNNLVTAFGPNALTLDAFSTTGDRLPLETIAQLNTTALNTDQGTWGVAILSLQADLPDTLPGQNVTFVVFGDSELITEESEDLTAPMQAFQLTTGIGVPQCREAPRDGVLVQSPEGTTVHFRVNGIDIAVGSTVLLDKRQDEKVWISTLEGRATVTSGGITKTVLPGYKLVTIPGEVPVGPDPYTFEDVAAMPIDLLPNPIVIPFTLAGDSADWQWSNYTVSAGITYQIRAEGQINLYADCPEAQPPRDDCNDYLVGPNGSTELDATGKLLPDQAIGALLMRLDDGDPIVVGRELIWTAPADGVLQFWVNDAPLDDNSGAFVIMVEPIIPAATRIAPTTPPQAPPPPPPPPPDTSGDDDDGADD